jgi:hypothetical protein
MLVALITVVCLGTARAITEKSGTTVGDFLTVPVGARAAAQGEACGVLATDASALHFNAAGLAGVKEMQLSLTHTAYYADISHDYLACAMPLAGGGLGASLTMLGTSFEKRLGDTDAADSNGAVSELALTVGYGRTLARDIRAGAVLKAINSKLDAYTASTAALDLGVQKTFTDTLSAGLSLRNWGGSLKYLGEAVPVANVLDVGVGKELLSKKLSLALDYQLVVNGAYGSVNIGAEYLLRVKSMDIAPRLGYSTGNGTLGAGVGVGYGKFNFDLALTTQADLGMKIYLSLGKKL